MTECLQDVGELCAACRTEVELRGWLKQYLGLDVPARAVCPDHQAPFEYLRRAYFEPGGDLVVWAPRGGGKTRLGAAATLLDLLHKPGCGVRILGGSLEQSLRMWEHLRPDLQRLAEQLLDGKPGARRVSLSNGSTAAVVTQSQRAVRGLRVQKLRCDEVEMFDPEVWEAAQLVTRSRRSAETPAGGFPLVAGAVEALSTLHEPDGLMGRIVERAQAAGTPVIKWCLLEVLERCPTERDCASCPLYEECAGRAKELCEGFVAIDDAIAMKRRVSRQTWEAEMLCRRPGVRNSVFPSFDPAVHVRQQVRAGWAEPPELWLAIDFGYANPFACLWVATWPDGTAYVIDEHVQEKWTIERHLTEIRARGHGEARKIACDPAGAGPNDQTAESNVSLLKRAGYLVRHRKSHIVDGLEMIRAALQPAAGQPTLFIHPRCKKLIKAMQSYRYAEGGGETPLKDGVHDHPIDALRYYYVNRAMGAGTGWRRY